MIDFVRIDAAHCIGWLYVGRARPCWPKVPGRLRRADATPCTRRSPGGASHRARALRAPPPPGFRPDPGGRSCRARAGPRTPNERFASRNTPATGNSDATWWIRPIPSAFQQTSAAASALFRRLSGRYDRCLNLLRARANSPAKDGYPPDMRSRGSRQTSLPASAESPGYGKVSASSTDSS